MFINYYGKSVYVFTLYKYSINSLKYWQYYLCIKGYNIQFQNIKKFITLMTSFVSNDSIIIQTDYTLLSISRYLKQKVYYDQVKAPKKNKLM